MSQAKPTNSAKAQPGGFERVLDWLDQMVLRAWKLFVSLKAGIFLLSLIGVLSIYGTMRYSSNAALGDNGISMGRVLFFESRWFVALLLLFALQLAVSTWHVTKMSFGIFWKKDFRRGRVFYEHGRSPRAEVAVPGGMDEAETTFRRHFTRVHRDGNALFAHRGLISRIGPTIVHAGILMVIFSQIAKAAFIWSGASVTEGRFVAEEGAPAVNFISEPIDLAQQMTELNRRDRALPYWIRVLDFDEVKHANSDMPAYFSSLLEVMDPETQTVRVAQLDMNHSLKIGDLQFHQAGFVAVPDDGVQRINFDVRDAELGERIAVTDASPGVRVRVGETEHFLEVDGTEPGNRWRLFSRNAPNQVVAEGILSGGRDATFSFRMEEFYPDFRVNAETNTPENVSGDPNNPALRVTLLQDGEAVNSTWVFADEQLAAAVPRLHPAYYLQLEDIRVRRGREVANLDWSDPENAVFVMQVRDTATGSLVGRETLAMGQSSQSFPFKLSTQEPEALGTENGFAVRVLGPTQRYATILSVVNEPTVFWTKLGVIVLVLGACITFAVRYRAFYGWWDEKTGTLRVALVPRWGQSPVQDEFDRLVHVLSHGKGPVSRTEEKDAPPDEVAPEHQTVRPELAAQA
jgi:cytochrome c biogenesis protein ResB